MRNNAEEITALASRRGPLMHLWQMEAVCCLRSEKA